MSLDLASRPFCSSKARTSVLEPSCSLKVPIFTAEQHPMSCFALHLHLLGSWCPFLNVSKSFSSCCGFFLEKFCTISQQTSWATFTLVLQSISKLFRNQAARDQMGVPWLTGQFHLHNDQMFLLHDQMSLLDYHIEYFQTSDISNASTTAHPTFICTNKTESILYLMNMVY